MGDVEASELLQPTEIRSSRSSRPPSISSAPMSSWSTPNSANTACVTPCKPFATSLTSSSSIARPALDLLTLNALVAADSVLIPMQAEYFALEGVSELLDTVERIRQNLNPSLVVEGVVLTMYDDRTNLAQGVTAELKSFFGELLYRNLPSPATSVWPKLPATASPPFSTTQDPAALKPYLKLAEEVLNRIKNRSDSVTTQPSA